MAKHGRHVSQIADRIAMEKAYLACGSAQRAAERCGATGASIRGYIYRLRVEQRVPESQQPELEIEKVLRLFRAGQNQYEIAKEMRGWSLDAVNEVLDFWRGIDQQAAAMRANIAAKQAGPAAPGVERNARFDGLMTMFPDGLPAPELDELDEETRKVMQCAVR